METLIISWYGALIGLAVAIILILRKLNPVYSLFLGAIIGCLIGGANLAQTTSVIINGTQSIIGIVVRVLAAGVLAGVMMDSGAAETIARTIVKKLGGSKAILALSLATMIITAVGVFIPVAVLIVAPIGLAVAKSMGFSKISLLLALSGGGKAGNVISPNPNSIAVANGFGVELSEVMMYGFIPAVFGLIAAVTVAYIIKNKGSKIEDKDIQKSADTSSYPTFGKAIVAPVVAIFLLLINPIGSLLNIPFLQNIKLDAMYVLPVAGIIGMLAMGRANKILTYTASGINRMTATVLILIGAGAIAGLISASNLSEEIVYIINYSGISGTFLAPIAGILMAAATASTSTGVILASGSFGSAILNMGTAPISAAVMVHTGATVIDQLPQGNYFHVTADSMYMNIKERMKVVPYEAIVGGVMTIVSTLFYGFIL